MHTDHVKLDENHEEVKEAVKMWMDNVILNLQNTDKKVEALMLSRESRART